MAQQHYIFDLVFQQLNGTNTIHANRLLAHAIGIDETITFSTLITKCTYYKVNDMLEEDDWFYVTVLDLQESTTYNEHSQRKIIKHLVDKGLIEYKIKGMPAKRYFRIINNPDTLIALQQEGLRISKELYEKTAEKTPKPKNPEKSSSSKNAELVLYPENAYFSSSSKSEEQVLKNLQNKFLNNCRTSSANNEEHTYNHNLNNHNLKQSINQESFQQSARADSDVIDEIDNNPPVQDIIRQRIDYSSLVDQNPTNRVKIDEIVDNMAEMMACHSPTMRIGGKDIDTNFVKDRLAKIGSDHIEYILLCLKRNTTKVNNIKAYLQTVIFNAPSTIDNYFSSEVNNFLYGDNDNDNYT